MRKHKPKKNKIMVPVASMGDIAFLLIIFFMVCSNFAKNNLDLDPPTAEQLEKLEQTAITVGIDRIGRIFVDGALHPDAKAVEQSVQAKIEMRRRLLSPNDSDDKIRQVIFRADRNLNRDTFIPVMAAISKGGGIIAATGLEGP